MGVDAISCVVLVPKVGSTGSWWLGSGAEDCSLSLSFNNASSWLIRSSKQFTYAFETGLGKASTQSLYAALNRASKMGHSSKGLYVEGELLTFAFGHHS